MSYDLKVLEQGCEELGIALNDTQKQQFIAFYEYLAEKNKVMNLTGITEFQEVLVKHFLAKYGKEKNPSLTGFSRKAMNLLMQYKWPGNVRELENLVERLLVLCDGPEVDTCDLPDKILAGAVQTTSAVPHIDLPESGIDLSSAVSEFEKSIIIQALNRSNWVKNRAAKLLHVNRTTLVEKIKKQKLQRPVEVKLG